MKKNLSILVTFALLISLISVLQTNSSAATLSTRVYYKVINRNSGKLLEVSNSSVTEGSGVVQGTLDGSSNQQWRLVDTGDGYYKIINRNSNKLLGVNNSSTNDGDTIIQETDKTVTSQQWTLKDIGGGYYKIINRNSGKLIDVNSASIADNGKISQWADNEGKNQQWYIIAFTTGNITYTLVREQNPTADQLDAYAKITDAMDSAILYYNNLTNITKKLTVYYNTSVSTADANINGTIRFGSNRSYMVTCTAMHEIGHSVGVGQSSGWFSLVKNNIYNGANAIEELRNITGNSTEVLHGDNMHFWPYGLNYSSEVKSDADYINHCRIVRLMKKDGV